MCFTFGVCLMLWRLDQQIQNRVWDCLARLWRVCWGMLLTLLRSFLMASEISFCLSVNKRFKFFSCLIRCSKHLDLPVSKAFRARATAVCSLDILGKTEDTKMQSSFLHLSRKVQSRYSLLYTFQNIDKLSSLTVTLLNIKKLKTKKTPWIKSDRISFVCSLFSWCFTVEDLCTENLDWVYLQSWTFCLLLTF